MKANLTDYISIFAAFDPNFDATISSPVTKARNCYQGTKNFLALLDKHTLEFPELTGIKSRLADLNEFFATQLSIQTNGLIKLSENTPKANAYSHMLAKNVIQNPNQFFQLIEEFMQSVDNITKQAQFTTLDEKQKLDEVDRTLISSAKVSLGFQQKFFGGAMDINAKTSRSNESLFANGDFKGLASPELKLDRELSNVVETLQQFIYRNDAVDNKLGFKVDAPSVSFAPQLR